MTAAKLEEMTFTRVVSDELADRAGARSPRHAWHRARSLPALGMPVPRRRRRVETVLSVGIHILMIWLLLRPEALRNLNPDLKPTDQGNLGNGIAGGGGGGTRGTGGVKYIQVSPPPQPVAPPAEAVVPPTQPVLELPKPVLPEPVIPQIELPKPATSESRLEVKVESPIIGTGGGIGNDGTKGNGPGTGGGIGNGNGTGVGSGTGPGTGAGKLDHIKCKNIEMLIPPLPAPDNVRGAKVLAEFDVDERGKLLKVQFTPTRNGDYNRKLNDVLNRMRFKAGTTLQGVPIRTTCQMEISL
jgi:periplasmic protein TonB